MGRYDTLLQPSKPPAPKPQEEKQGTVVPLIQREPSPRKDAQDVGQKVDHQDILIPRYCDTTVPALHDTVVSGYQDTMTPRYQETTLLSEEGELLEAVRKSVKQVGKEPATQRLTLEEKQTLRAIEYTYGQQGILTSGNEIIRIATNYILKDYQKKGDHSILASVLKLLNS